jgi:hypothetical protein
VVSISTRRSVEHPAPRKTAAHLQLDLSSSDRGQRMTRDGKEPFDLPRVRHVNQDGANTLAALDTGGLGLPFG